MADELIAEVRRRFRPPLAEPGGAREGRSAWLASTEDFYRRVIGRWEDEASWVEAHLGALAGRSRPGSDSEADGARDAHGAERRIVTDYEARGGATPPDEREDVDRILGPLRASPADAALLCAPAGGPVPRTALARVERSPEAGGEAECEWQQRGF